ncbi:MAG: hypothetical protein WC932_05500 [archaeon]|jgi:hypothetical protein
MTTSDKGKIAITVDPKNPKNRFYTKVEKNQFNLPSRITHLTPEARRILKENPELIEFVQKEFLKKNTTINAKLETKTGLFRLQEKRMNGSTHNKICELLFKDKKTGKIKKYFVKEYLSLSTVGNAEAEFLAVKEMERLGFNIIKPQFAITKIKHGTPNIVVYDYTNLETYHDAFINGKIKIAEMLEIEDVFKKLPKSLELKELEDYYRYHYRFEPNNNVFVKRLPNGKLKLYFTDLYWEEKAYKRKKEEYL